MQSILNFVGFLYFLSFFYWGIADLQCCDILCCTAKWLGFFLFLYSFTLWFIPGDQIQFPVLHSRTLLLIHSKCHSLHPLIPTPNSQSIPFLPLGNHKSDLYVCEDVSIFFKKVHLYHILDSTYKWYRMVFLFLSSFCMIIYSCIHFVANGIFCSFFMALYSFFNLYGIIYFWEAWLENRDISTL